MDLFKVYYFRNEARLKGHRIITSYQQDLQSQFESQAHPRIPLKKR